MNDFILFVDKRGRKIQIKCDLDVNAYHNGKEIGKSALIIQIENQFFGQ